MLSFCMSVCVAMLFVALIIACVCMWRRSGLPSFSRVCGKLFTVLCLPVPVYGKALCYLQCFPCVCSKARCCTDICVCMSLLPSLFACVFVPLLRSILRVYWKCLCCFQFCVCIGKVPAAFIFARIWQRTLAALSSARVYMWKTLYYLHFSVCMGKLFAAFIFTCVCNLKSSWLPSFLHVCVQKLFDTFIFACARMRKSCVLPSFYVYVCEKSLLPSCLSVHICVEKSLCLHLCVSV